MLGRMRRAPLLKSSKAKLEAMADLAGELGDDGDGMNREGRVGVGGVPRREGPAARGEEIGAPPENGQR
jgi:hypothetical protein